MRAASRTGRRLSGRLALACALLLSACGGSPPAARSDWPRFGGDADNTRYSPLRQVDARNVARLRQVWTLDQGPQLTLWETFPVVVGRTMYVSTNTAQVLAVDAVSGRVHWTFTPRVDFSSGVGDAGQSPVSRGVTVASGRVFVMTFDNQLTALDARDGHVLWARVVADARAGMWSPSPPTYWQGRLFVGGASNRVGTRGFVAAYDAASGRPLWRFNTTRATGGGDVWMPPTIDLAAGPCISGPVIQRRP